MTSVANECTEEHDKVILEVKAKQGGISDDDYAKTINNLRISGCKVGLIINFGTSKMGIKRVIFLIKSASVNLWQTLILIKEIIESK